jgi:hypothetical protein
MHLGANRYLKAKYGRVRRSSQPRSLAAFCEALAPVADHG